MPGEKPVGGFARFVPSEFSRNDVLTLFAHLINSAFLFSEK